MTLLKAQLDFRGWKGLGARGGEGIASGAAIAQATRGVFIVCSEASANLLLFNFILVEIWSFRANSSVRLGEPKAGPARAATVEISPAP